MPVGNGISEPVIGEVRTVAVGTATRPAPVVYHFTLPLANVGTKMTLPMLGRDSFSVTIKEPGNTWGSGIVTVKGSNDPDGLAASAHSSPITYTAANQNTTVSVSNNSQSRIVSAYVVFEVTTAEADVVLEFSVFAFSSV
jgi:hypothetical protein